MPLPATICALKGFRNAYLVLPRATRRWIVGGAMVVVLTVCVAVLVAFALVRSSPRWWRTIIREDPATISLAVNLENRVINSINDHKPKPPAVPGQPWRSDPWTIPVHASEANAWLNVRLPMWLANQQEKFHWPRNVSDLQVDFIDRQVTVGARVRSGDRYQVLTATLEPRLDKGGELWLQASTVNLGRLSIPASWVLERAKTGSADYVPTDLRQLEETQRLFRAFEGRESIANNSQFRFEGRTVRILEVRTSAGVVEITCQTERAD